MNILNRLKHFWYYITSKEFRILVSNAWYLESEEIKVDSYQFRKVEVS